MRDRADRDTSPVLHSGYGSRKRHLRGSSQIDDEGLAVIRIPVAGRGNTDRQNGLPGGRPVHIDRSIRTRPRTPARRLARRIKNLDRRQNQVLRPGGSIIDKHFVGVAVGDLRRNNEIPLIQHRIRLLEKRVVRQSAREGRLIHHINIPDPGAVPVSRSHYHRNIPVREKTDALGNTRDVRMFRGITNLLNTQPARCRGGVIVPHAEINQLAARGNVHRGITVRRRLERIEFPDLAGPEVLDF
ncbi:MAG: hypothetical protein BWY49_00595 [Candidatus Omnitrophica bacterium ADurb.Bin314]|nr:MAG: hypothetical protein BWY49_00595 [Candidatus Omnitrophica bacterium ADurb.Bin314]